MKDGLPLSRPLAGSRQETLTSELWRLRQRLYEWETAQAEASASEQRNIAAALTRLREAIDSDMNLASKVSVLGELRTLLEREQSLASSMEMPNPALEERTRQVYGAMQRTEEALADYNIVADDAVFAASHFPLSLMAAAADIRTSRLTAK